MRNYKSYFFNTKIYFDNYFYFNKFIYLVLLQNFNNFVSFKITVVARWLIEKKRPVDAPALLVLSRVLFLIDRIYTQIEAVTKMPS